MGQYLLPDFKKKLSKKPRDSKMSRKIENEDINKIRVLFDDDEDFFKTRGQGIRSDSNSIFNRNGIIGNSSLMNRDPFDDDFFKTRIGDQFPAFPAEFSDFGTDSSLISGSRASPRMGSQLRKMPMMPAATNELFDNEVSYTDGGRKFKTQITLGNGGQFSNINIGVKSGMLTVTASHEEEINDNGFISKSSSSVSRCIQLPNKFIKDSIKAECVGATVQVSGEIEIDKVEEVNSGINIPISFE